MSEKEKRAKLCELLKTLSATMSEIAILWEEELPSADECFGDGTIDNILSESYPFALSFDEQTAEVYCWVKDATDAIENL